jgi:hypothetical protein
VLNLIPRSPLPLLVGLMISVAGLSTWPRPSLAAEPGGGSPVISTTVAGRPRLLATRIAHAPLIDGRVDDDVWNGVPGSAAFTQKFPLEGQRPEEQTLLRVAYDDEAVFVAIECQQQRAPVIGRLTRRDRMVESDWVSVAIDTRRDGRSGFDFTVNAAGVLADSIRFDDTSTSADWDENWDARTHVTPGGWSVELRIPLRILRFASLPIQSWGFQVRRHVSARQETDEWAFIPRSSAGEVSQYGTLEGLRGLGSGQGVEVTPFLWTRYRRRDGRAEQLARGTDLGAAAGLDLKWHPSQALTLDGAALPDFAQVEADQVILNLTNLETNYPEKRRFFAEGIDTFTTPQLQLLYTRRIGRVPAAPVLRPGEQLVEPPGPSTIYGALKLAGRFAGSWEVGALSAVTADNRVAVQLPGGTRIWRTVDPLSVFNVIRVKDVVGGNGHVGLTATSVFRLEPVSDNPTVDDRAAPGAQALCPSGLEIAAGARCSNDAYAVSLDWRWRSPSGDYETVGQVTGSILENGPARPLVDGTVIAPGDVGQSVRLALTKEGGAHWVWSSWAAADGRKLEVNDVSFLDRPNVVGFGGDLSFRTLQPRAGTLETASKLTLVYTDNFDGRPLERTVLLDETVKLTSFWLLAAGWGWSDWHFDDREVGDGAALERGARRSLTLKVETDPRARVFARLNASAGLVYTARDYQADLTVTLHLLPRLDLELVPRLLHARGEPRFAGTNQPGSYLFGRLAAQSADLTLRATYTFTPRVTLDGYAQLFAAFRHYYDFSYFTAPASVRRPAIRLDALRPAAGPGSSTDQYEGVLNINLVLRWEFRQGCLMYLVYTRSQVPQLTLQPGDVARLDFRPIQRGAAADVVLLKVAYWWGG